MCNAKNQTQHGRLNDITQHLTLKSEQYNSTSSLTGSQ